MNAKKTLSLSLASAMALGLLAGCGSSASSAAASTADSTASAADSTSTAATSDAAGKVYYLNFKPEQDEAWQDLAAKYTEETGDTNISTFQFKTQDGSANGYAADWHPTAKTHDIAAAELTEYIKSLM